MTRDRAVKMAVDALERQMQTLHWDANLFEKTGIGKGQHGERAYKKREKFREAIRVLQEPVQIAMFGGGG